MFNNKNILNYYKLIAFDLDGTLLNNNMEISNYSKKCIKKIIKNDIKCIIISSRTLNNILLIIKDIPFCYIAALDGGIIYNAETKKIEKINYIEKKLLKELLNIYNNPNIIINIYTKNEVYISRFSKNPLTCYYQKSLSPKFISDYSYNKKISGIHLIIEKPLCLKNIYNELSKNYNKFLSIKNAGFNFIVLNNKKTNKGNTIKYVSKILNIPLKQTISIGDSQADLEMIKKSGHGVGMINGDKKLLKHVKNITEKDNNNDGALKYLLRKLKINS